MRPVNSIVAPRAVAIPALTVAVRTLPSWVTLVRAKSKRMRSAIAAAVVASMPPATDGMDTLLAGQTVHPRATLSKAAKVVQHALEKNSTVIDAACVKVAGESQTQTAIPDFSEGIEGAI